jgi:hypothetical protein
MLQTDKDSIKIEIEGFSRHQAGILFYMIFDIPILLFLFIVCIEAIKELSLLSIPLCGFMALLICLKSLYIHGESKKVIRLESVEGGFRATKLSMKVTLFRPDQVCQIQEGYGHIVLVLDDGKKLDFAKTDRLYFNGRYTVRDDHIWVPFFTSQRFPNARYTTLRFPK